MGNYGRFFSALSLAFLAACEPTPMPEHMSVSAVSERGEGRIKFEQIVGGDTLSWLADGVYTAIVPKDIAGTPNDLKCIVFKDRDGSGESSVSHTGVSCDWGAANNSPAP